MVYLLLLMLILLYHLVFPLFLCILQEFFLQNKVFLQNQLIMGRNLFLPLVLLKLLHLLVLLFLRILLIRFRLINLQVFLFQMIFFFLQVLSLNILPYFLRGRCVEIRLKLTFQQNNHYFFVSNALFVFSFLKNNCNFIWVINKAVTYMFFCFLIYFSLLKFNFSKHLEILIWT